MTGRAPRVASASLLAVVVVVFVVVVAFARVWIDARDPARTTLYLADGAWERVLVRTVATPQALDEVAREEIGHIVQDAVAALRAGLHIGFTTRDEARASLRLAPLPAPA